MSTTYTVAVAGLGKRGVHHADAVARNARFKIVGLCDIDAGASTRPRRSSASATARPTPRRCSGT